MRIGLFDSGVGGLTVLKTLLDKYPNNEYIYFGDTRNLPYGDKGIDELIKLAKNNIDFLISKKVEMIIIACGTISSNCLNVLKKCYDIPIISVIEPTIKYLNKSNYNNILIMATHATINSHIFKNKVSKNVYEMETPRLVPLIENNDMDKIIDVLHGYIDQYRNNVDCLVLGCTHYPIIKDYIKQVINVPIIDMGKLITIDNYNERLLEIYFSKIDDKIINNVKYILKMDNLDNVLKEIDI